MEHDGPVNSQSNGQERPNKSLTVSPGRRRIGSLDFCETDVTKVLNTIKEVEPIVSNQ